MFYILMILGTGFIVLGFMSKKGYENVSKEDILIEEESVSVKSEDKVSERNDIKLLEKRIDLLEDILFKETLEKEEVKRTVFLEEIEEDSLEKYKLIERYEKENKSIDQIAKLLNMNKGEVLLLKSLYKNL